MEDIKYYETVECPKCLGAKEVKLRSNSDPEPCKLCEGKGEVHRGQSDAFLNLSLYE